MTDTNPLTNGMTVPNCDVGTHRARWSICRMEGVDKFGQDNWVVRAFACGRHLSGVLDRLDWILDAVMVYDLAMVGEES